MQNILFSMINSCVARMRLHNVIEAHCYVVDTGQIVLDM